MLDRDFPSKLITFKYAVLNIVKMIRSYALTAEDVQVFIENGAMYLAFIFDHDRKECAILLQKAVHESVENPFGEGSPLVKPLEPPK